MYLSILIAQVGLDPERDVDWITMPDGGLIEPFVEGEVDAVLGFPPSLRSSGPAASAV